MAVWICGWGIVDMQGQLYLGMRGQRTPWSDVVCSTSVLLFPSSELPMRSGPNRETDPTGSAESLCCSVRWGGPATFSCDLWDTRLETYQQNVGMSEVTRVLLREQREPTLSISINLQNPSFSAKLLKRCIEQVWVCLAGLHPTIPDLFRGTASGLESFCLQIDAKNQRTKAVGK